ncbi:signal peptidase I [Chloroflexota bacterium]
MKKAIGLIIIIAAFTVAFLSVRGAMPFIPIFGSSMEPTLQSGGLLIIEPIDPYDVKEGDIIIFNVPSAIREYYSYPPTVSHRVIEVKTDHPGLRFRTKGDNTGEDPFSIMPRDIKGTVGDQIPYLGLPLLFFQSQQGTIFIIVALSLLALFLYSDELSLGGRRLQWGIFNPVIRESHRTNRVLAQKIDSTEKKMENTEQALDKFATAIAEYAQHLASHTSAIQGLAEASHELKKSAAEQNRVLAHLMENMGQPNASAPVIPEIAAEKKPAQIEESPREETIEVDNQVRVTYPPGCIKIHITPPGKNSGHHPNHTN